MKAKWHGIKILLELVRDDLNSLLALLPSMSNASVEACARKTLHPTTSYFLCACVYI